MNSLIKRRMINMKVDKIKVLSMLRHSKFSQVVVQVMKANGLEALDLTWDGNSTVSSTIHGKYFQGTTGS